MIYLISLTTGLISRYQSEEDKLISPEKKSRNRLLVPKEALIGEHNLKPLFTVHKENMIGRVFWVISQL